MHIKEKINFKKYFVLSTVSTLVAFLFTSRSFEHFIGVSLIALAGTINLFALSEILYEFIHKDVALGRRSINKTKIFMLVPLKLGIFIGTLILGVQLMDHLIIIPLLNYVAQIGILFYSQKGNARE